MLKHVSTLVKIDIYPIDRPRYRAYVLRSACSGDIRIKLTHIGNFDDLYWVGVEEDSELEKLVKRIRRAFADNGIPFDRKKFYPHITVVRGVFYDGKGLPDVSVETVEMNVDQISLMRSDRGKSGMIYTCVGMIPE